MRSGVFSSSLDTPYRYVTGSPLAYQGVARRAPAGPAALSPLPASARMGVYIRSVVVVEDCIGGPT